MTILLVVTGCSPKSAAPTETQLSTASETPGLVTPESIAGEENAAASCDLEPLIVPTPLAVTPGYTMRDGSIGLHVTGNAQEIDPESYRLKISGLVDNPLELTINELRCMPQISDDPILVCEGYFTDKATWTGVSLSYVLDLAGLQPEAKSVILISADGYRVTLSMMEAKNERNMLAYQVNGQTLPILHGFPLRAVIPLSDGNDWIKWLVEIQVE